MVEVIRIPITMSYVTPNADEVEKNTLAATVDTRFRRGGYETRVGRASNHGNAAD